MLSRLPMVWSISDFREIAEALRNTQRRSQLITEGLAWAGNYEAQWGKRTSSSKVLLHLGRNAEKLLRQRKGIADRRELYFCSQTNAEIIKKDSHRAISMATSNPDYLVINAAVFHVKERSVDIGAFTDGCPNNF
jgi:hypothetical protein